jgi:serine/threonine-protein kinase
MLAHILTPDEKTTPLRLRRGSHLGKYRLIRRLGQGGFGDVWRAMDTIEGLPVALKIPHRTTTDKQLLYEFRHEARMLAQLDHPNILRLKNADFIDGQLILAYEAGIESLAQRIERRYRTDWALGLMRQILEGLTAAHAKKIIHRDVKPENIFLFAGDHVRIGDFGIACLADENLNRETSSGTLGFMAPEQAYGLPSRSSDVFSAGLVLYQLLSGYLPSWPFKWPYPEEESVRRKVPPEMISVIRKATAFEPKGRYPDAKRMLAAYDYALSRYHRMNNAKKSKPAPPVNGHNHNESFRWEWVRVREFEKQFRKRYGLHYSCRKCGNPVGEAMSYCPWCKTNDNSFREVTSFPAFCPDCERGVRLEWKFCPWCYSGRFTDHIDRRHSDPRYTERCGNASCKDRRLMPYMRYCPSCKTKVKRPPRLQENEAPCPHCRWPIPKGGFWKNCGWCGKNTS